MLRTYLIATAMVAIVMFPLDFLWLKLSHSFYVGQIGSLLIERPRLSAAAIFYVIYAFGLAFFVVVPTVQGGTLMSVAARGALLGLLAYGTYDASNYATLKAYTLSITVVDWTWGTVLTAVSSAIAWKLTLLWK